jgi:hypothetical protein
MHPINEFGSEAQKEKYLPGLAMGELVGAFVSLYYPAAPNVTKLPLGPDRTEPRF